LQGIPKWTDRLQHLHASLSSAFERATPDFQTKVGVGYQAQLPCSCPLMCMLMMACPGLYLMCMVACTWLMPRLAPAPRTSVPAAASPRCGVVARPQVGYAVNAPGTANLGVATNAVAQRFDCCAVTLEMPFKDTADHPEPVQVRGRGGVGEGGGGRAQPCPLAVLGSLCPRASLHPWAACQPAPCVPPGHAFPCGPSPGCLMSSRRDAHAARLQGWSPERSMGLGAALLPAVLEVLPQLR
jgi:hypothetical protein